jgi:hypothetical protein
MQLMLKARDTLFRVWELAVSFLGLPPLARVQRENTNRRRTVQRRTIWIADAHCDNERRFVVGADEKLTAFVELESATRGNQSIGTSKKRLTPSCPERHHAALR